MTATGVQEIDRVARDGVARSLLGLLALGLIALAGGFLAGLLMLQLQRAVQRSAPDSPEVQAGYRFQPSSALQPTLLR